MKIADSKPVEVTVIMAVYNVKDYICRSIESFLAQTLTNFELLLVDDGSTDDSGKICDEYAESDSRIKVFHKPNGGVASARALGLEKATGKYIIHSDPDDWVEPEMLSEMFTLAERNHSDIVFADYYRNYTNNKQVYFSVSPAKDPLVCISHTLLNGTHNSFGIN
ncbi:MAG: glycosyltransferase family 2 protein [Candidatus Ozemobacteraceae bacterium]